MTEAGVAARRSAIYLLDQVLGENRLLSECFGAGALDRLEPEDRARAQRLTSETLRGLERADRILQKHLKKYPPLTVRNALRLGTVELCHGEAAHGVVNAMVTIIGANQRHNRLKGLVNAVLRKVAAEGPDAWPKMRAPRLPKWLRDPLVDAWGGEAVSAMEIAHFNGAPLDLTLRAGKDGPGVEAIKLPTGSIRLKDRVQISSLPGFASGDWWVQDAAAALPVRILAPQAGERVLDMCAAPGGKTMQLADAGAQVVALDISEQRMRLVAENLRRTGLDADMRVEDGLTHDGFYDAILLDAPCSATGTIRRHPDLPFAKDGSEFSDLIELQAAMLTHAWGLLKPGGRLVFCTCSLLPDEGEVQVESALSRHSDMRTDPEALMVSGVARDWLSEEGGVRLRPDYWPDTGGMDGFYIACLRKEQQAPLDR